MGQRKNPSSRSSVDRAPARGVREVKGSIPVGDSFFFVPRSCPTSFPGSLGKMRDLGNEIGSCHVDQLIFQVKLNVIELEP